MRAEGGEGTGLPDPRGFHPDHMTDALSPPTSKQMWRDTPYLLEEGSDGTHEDGHNPQTEIQSVCTRVTKTVSVH